MANTTAKVIKDAIYGALIGDAVGVPYEFSDPVFLPDRWRLDLHPPVSFNRAHRGTPPGTYSDDGALMLALMDSLSAHYPFNLHDYAARILMFARQGAYAVDRRVFDIGMQTQTGISEFEAGTDPHESGGKDVRDNGNGALMRVLPVAFWGRTDEEIVDVAMKQGRPTHGHIRSRFVCALYALIANRLARGWNFGQARIDAEDTLYGMRERLPDDGYELKYVLTYRSHGKGSGYVLDTFQSAMQVLENNFSYKEVIQAAIALGNDTDTTACVAGGLAGIMFGIEGMPGEWVEGLRNKEEIDRIIDTFVESRPK